MRDARRRSSGRPPTRPVFSPRCGAPRCPAAAAPRLCLYSCYIARDTLDLDAEPQNTNCQCRSNMSSRVDPRVCTCDSRRATSSCIRISLSASQHDFFFFKCCLSLDTLHCAADRCPRLAGVIRASLQLILVILSTSAPAVC